MKVNDDIRNVRQRPKVRGIWLSLLLVLPPLFAGSPAAALSPACDYGWDYCTIFEECGDCEDVDPCGATCAELSSRLMNEVCSSLNAKESGCPGSILSPTPPIGPLVETFWKNDNAIQGDLFTVGFIVKYASPFALPVTVSVQDVTMVPVDGGPGTQGCFPTDGAAFIISSGSEKSSYRLYPESMGQLVDERMFPSTIEIRVSGHAGTAAGNDAYKNLVCGVQLTAVITDGVNANTQNPLQEEVQKLIATVTALPKPKIDLLQGHFQATDTGDETSTVVATPSLGTGIPITGPEDRLVLGLSATVSYHEVVDETWDRDYAEFQMWKTGGEELPDSNMVQEVSANVNEMPKYGGSFLILDGESVDICSQVVIKDGERWSGDDHEVISNLEPGPICNSFAYTRIDTTGPMEIDTTPECDAVIHEHLTGANPSPDAHLTCALSLGSNQATPLDQSFPIGNYGYLPVPAQINGVWGFFVLPPVTE